MTTAKRMTGEKMCAFLALEAKEARERAGISAEGVAYLAQRNPTTVYRFELGDSYGEDPDRLVAAYALAVGIDGRNLWAKALARWRKDGEAPSLDGEPGDALRSMLRRELDAAAQDSDQASQPGRRTSSAKGSRQTRGSRGGA